MQLLGISINPLTIILGFNILIALAGLGYVLYNRLRVKQTVLYFSEGESLFDEININGVSPVALYNTNLALRFIRTGRAYKNRLGNKVIWLAKRGTAYLMKLEETTIEVEEETGLVDEEDKPVTKTITKKVAKNLGTLWEGLNMILGTELCEDFSTDVKEKLMKSEYIFTVELEAGKTPKGFKPLNENDIRNETSERMSELVFSGVREALKEDYVKAFGFIAIGVALVLLAQQLGVL